MRKDPDMARLVTVPSPQQDISRSHLEITLEGWHVLLADLNTTNGTTLLRPGQSPRRLHPGEPTLMADGDSIDMGDGVTLTFAGLQ
jgi:pSer/pThr/pTyr-binding forkhead associated (FHA) protein